MNYLPRIISHLSASEDMTEIYLVPKAFIMEKRDGKLLKLSDTVLTPEDIKDTLVALRGYASSASGPLGKEGMFSFGFRNIGRLRVKYITQRGSYVVHILKTPYHIPPINKLCPDKSSTDKLEKIIRLNSSGLVIFEGKNHLLVNTLIYSLLQDVCQNYSKVVLILETPLTFLLGHGQSLVIQREVGVDVDTFEEGLRDAFYMNPHILFISPREMIPPKDLEYIFMIANLNTLVMLNIPVVGKAFIEVFKPFIELFEPLIKAWVYVNAEETKTLSLNFKHIEPQALESR